MNSPIYLCEHCGYIGYFDLVKMTDGNKLYIEGIATVCENCGKIADVISGLYNFSNGFIESIRGVNLLPIRVGQLISFLK